MRGGCSGEATTLWLSLQLCALSVSESAVARVGSTPRADCHCPQMQVPCHHETISIHTPQIYVQQACSHNHSRHEDHVEGCSCPCSQRIKCENSMPEHQLLFGGRPCFLSFCTEYHPIPELDRCLFQLKHTNPLLSTELHRHHHSVPGHTTW
uniref:Uncharacterized protein n=1 Tax=Opuntia streptacantha TaxID=393608 RepID=A0A7C9DEU0_OPUST